MSSPAPSSARRDGEPVDLARLDNAVHRAEGLAVADPAGPLADEVAAELSSYLPPLLTQAESRLVAMGGSTPAAQRARDVLADSIRHGQAVHEDQRAAVFTNPVARLYLLTGACRLLKNAVVPRW
ncbi:hypothetical protein ACFYO9_22115 [Streptomyces sp. NPDC005863]|uniref:hypothetical protein n=1 Tax=unclassified Streptomyces TaxID=2593676 RepID=UPI0033F35C5E